MAVTPVGGEPWARAAGASDELSTSAVVAASKTFHPFFTVARLPGLVGALLGGQGGGLVRAAPHQGDEAQGQRHARDLERQVEEVVDVQEPLESIPLVACMPRWGHQETIR